MNIEESFVNYKLCGYIVIISNDHPQHQFKNLSIPTQCHLSDSSFRLTGKNNDEVIIYVGDAKGKGKVDDDHDDDDMEAILTDSSSGKGKGKMRKMTKRRRSIGVVKRKGVMSQLSCLVEKKCLKVECRVVAVEEERGRVVVLVDVYLNNDVWGGRQFQKASATMIASLFSHVSYDWDWRTKMLLGNHDIDNTLWDQSQCHVLGCKVHVKGSSEKSLFDLHEIFKSLPGAVKDEKPIYTSLKPADPSFRSGIVELPNDVLINNVLSILGPKELVKVASTCHHLKSLGESIMPCLLLKLFPHQQAAVEWMLQRERRDQVLVHPLYMVCKTEDDFDYYIDSISGEIESGLAPTVTDFCGGMFCDEPGLGKTITALSLILKTKGTVVHPPDGVEVIWCKHNHDQRYGYYELNADNFVHGNFMPSLKRIMRQNGRRGQSYAETLTTPKGKSSSNENCLMLPSSCPNKVGSLTSTASSLPVTRVRRKTMSSVKRNLLGKYEEEESPPSKKRRICNETWVLCEKCQKWRRLPQASSLEEFMPWSCSMNPDVRHQNCRVPEESWDNSQLITYLPGFHKKESLGGLDENVSFFASVLKDQHALVNSKTKKALTWLANLPEKKLVEMETVGLPRPVLDTSSVGVAHEYQNIFKAFGLIKIKLSKNDVVRWHYPPALDNLAFDVAALRTALTKPLDMRLYLSRATLIVVPTNLVDHWQTQIQFHVRPGQLRVYVWTDNKAPPAHNLAWDYDVVITTFNRLSAEWGTKKRSALMQVHWLRVMLDEGHTLGSSLCLTNKLQMAIALTASNRWILTGTPTPNTPNSQISHLQPMLKFLHEDVYGQNQKSWDAGIIKPFEAGIEEGRLRLLQLLHRSMISARKEDLQNLPPCNKKLVLLDFTEEHAKTYNELVVTVRRNILMADWNDPSHVESLLNPKQWKLRNTTIKNVRLSCCVAGHIKVEDAGQDIQETMDILVNNGLDQNSDEYRFIRRSVLNGCSCFRCKEWCRLPVITPCKHLLCLDCVALDSEKCSLPGCSNPYEMQSPKILTRPENPNPKWPVPKDLIELQPSYQQDDWDPDWQSTSSSKVSYLVERMKSLRKDQLYNKTSPPEKVIIFSQFLEHLHVIEQQLLNADIVFTGMYSPMQLNIKRNALKIFRGQDDCMALLMDGSAALGLDLSFVNHVFLMEPIWDRSMEEQVISRAHRMGATRPINVETLVMRGTIEERMCAVLQDTDRCRALREEYGSGDHEGARFRRSTVHDFAQSSYLSELNFVRTQVKA